MRVQLGTVSHFNISVEDPGASAAWWVSNFDLDEWSRSEKGILLGNDAIMIGLTKGTPVSGVLGHLAFRTSDVDALVVARDALRANGVDLEDPGNEIGPVAPGSASVGLWFHDGDGYRWELYVEGPDA
ncbi:MAG TPA: VOC family protein [Candidatus Elarobacter sp.]|jgi:catechol 2,3-dioxygenase-like lactoylglutathione lyase family enzyme|nr:VOC family protein [Candidatus Elarobacter sp.]